MIDDKQLVIIMGAPRSGTTWLQAMLDAHPDVVTMSELWVLDYTATWLRQWQVQADKPNAIGLPLLWSHDDLLAEMRAFAQETYTRLLGHHPDARVILDKTPRYVRSVHQIHALFPDVRFIHIIRDGRDVVASTLAASQSWGSNWATTDARRAAANWAYDVQAGREAARYTGQYTEVRYEALLAHDIDTLMRAFNIAGLSLSTDELRAIYDAHTLDKMRQQKTRQPNADQDQTAGIMRVPRTFYRKGQAQSWRTDLTSAQKYQVYQAAQALLVALDYASDDEWWTENAVDRYLTRARCVTVECMQSLPKMAKRVFRS